MRVALVTSRVLSHPDPDEPLLVSALKTVEPEWEIEVPVWDDPAVSWREYDAVVIRSTWDYASRRDTFVAWAKTVAEQTLLWNPAELIEWNTDKRYLRKLEAKGVSVIPTVWGTAGEHIDFENLMKANGWKEIVIKPVVSASGKDTHRISKNNLAEELLVLKALIRARDVMIQPYFKSVETAGELSFLFMNGHFSHAVQKIPAQGEFLVQEHFGGKNFLFEPNMEQAAFAESVLKQLPWPTLYARVDAMIGDDGRLALGELEVTEPSMYLIDDPESPLRFARAIQNRLRQDVEMSC
jgi:glutathione synthase/RimK-type ligase-like ATP-grasp enzyme